MREEGSEGGREGEKEGWREKDIAPTFPEAGRHGCRVPSSREHESLPLTVHRGEGEGGRWQLLLNLH